MKSKKEIRIKKRYSIRKKISGTADRPRLAVFRSNKEIYVQLIDDLNGHTISSASSRDNELKSSKSTKTEQAQSVGKLIAENAKKVGVSSVIFDRGGFVYHGRIKALADAARESGLKF